MVDKRKSARRASTTTTMSKTASPDPSSDYEDADERFHKIIIDDESQSDADHSDYEPGPSNKRKKTSEKKRLKKRARLSSGSAPSLPDMSDVEEASNDEEFVVEHDLFRSVGTPSNKVAMREKLVPASMTGITARPTMLQIHLTPKQDGSSVINLNVADLLQATLSQGTVIESSEAFENLSRARQLLARSRRNKYEQANPPKAKTSYAGFLDLPVELRSQIYGKLFDRSNMTIDFTSSRPSIIHGNFLATCKTVCDEGSRVLYGRNNFLFQRDGRTRGQFWEQEWKEIGFKDVRRFLSMIGKVNVSHLRTIKFSFSDALPSVTRYLLEAQRKFVNDPIVYSILDIIGGGETLKELTLEFKGRSTVSESNYHFLLYLTRIKCHNLVCNEYTSSGWTNRICPTLTPKIMKLMVVPKEDEEPQDQLMAVPKEDENPQDQLTVVPKEEETTQDQSIPA